ncbi:hypothetical protein SDC9_85087 [bioreactor metagenome]|uniref:Uncharacterized protein n=1 Tax=bioreactor metagenome TaxID=1076179 RepID=A0A644ZDS4_9ZZZZ
MGILDFLKRNKNTNLSKDISINKLNNADRQNLDEEVYTLNYPIRYNSSDPSKLFNVNNLEKYFFKTLYKNLDSKENNQINLTRMHDGTLNVCYNSCQVGRIKLQGRKHSMQILYNLNDVECFTGTIDDFIPKIDYWIVYILRYLK